MQKSRHNDLPDTVIDTLKECDADIYPRIDALLQILATLPVTNASAERSFLVLRLLETWLRTAMLQSRLEGLALLHIHYDMEIKPEDIIAGQRRIVL
mgnify:CR=1 FL=1